MHVGGNVLRLDLALEQQTVDGLLGGERVEVALRQHRSARPRHGQNAHGG